jgi:lantibiotic modifying enzyme
MNTSKKNKLLTRIANHLMINASFLADLGLYHGKMGIVIFFAHYSRYTGNLMYDDFAGELMDEIGEELHTQLPIDFSEGLCGIGWGVEYLSQNNFTEGDSDQILENIDKRIMERDVLRVEDESLETGLAGISLYLQTRLKNKNRETAVLDTNYQNNHKKISSRIKQHIPEDVLKEILKETPDTDDILKMDLGLKKGIAGVGLKMILS